MILTTLALAAALSSTPIQEDPSPIPRLRFVHSDDPEVSGTTADLIQNDPWLAFAHGRELVARSFAAREGADGAAQSCAQCHGSPRGGLPEGTTPHLFGAGLIEMAARQVSLEVLRILDENEDGWIGLYESRGRDVFVATKPGDAKLYFGRHADQDGDHRPDLNEALVPIYVDAAGRWVPDADSLDHPEVAGYRVELRPFGHGLNGERTATLRQATIGALSQEMGLQAQDPTSMRDDDLDGFAEVSLLGALQATLRNPPDPGKKKTPGGLSIDDPDGDGAIAEITEGDLDLFETYLLNTPRPGIGTMGGLVRTGYRMLQEFRCTACHVPEWEIRETGPFESVAGDRRFFEYKAKFNERQSRLVGDLSKRIDYVGLIPSGSTTIRVTGMFTDLRYHDLGEEYAPQSGRRQFLTRPLWGVGSTAPYGFDGRSADLDDIIRRHGGHARGSIETYVNATQTERDALISFLSVLVLYDPYSLPADIDGNLLVDEPFDVRDVTLPREALLPELFFRMPARFPESVVGEFGLLHHIQNLEEAYGLQLPFMVDRDRDSFPDVIDLCPDRPGHLDGCRDGD